MNRSYSRVAGRLGAAQRQALARYAHKVGVPTQGGFHDVDPDWRLNAWLRAVYPQASGSLVLDVGSGHGEAAVDWAAAHPRGVVVAVEVWEEGIADTLRAGGELANLWVVRADAAAVLHRAVAPASVSELWTYFPDPWRKARHAKRRLIQEAFARDAARALAPGGVWRIATDWEDYAAQIDAVLVQVTQLRAQDGVRVRPVTHYERRALRAGRAIREWEVRRA